jgi:hypothetical protein
MTGIHIVDIFCTSLRQYLNVVHSSDYMSVMTNHTEIMHSLNYANTGTDRGTGMVTNPTTAMAFHWPASQW